MVASDSISGNIPLRRSFSVFLDLLRVTAASVVFLGHLSLPDYGGEVSPMFFTMAHSAVVVFFVLSGYLIAWTAQRDKSAVDYLINRAARIYSVALPALVLTYLLDIATGTITYQTLQPWKYALLSLAFATDLWFLNEGAFSNAPWWSLCYEVSYYIVFGIVLFGRGWWRWGLAAASLALMGPRLWLLFPVWLLGAALHRIPRLPRPPLLLGLALLGIVVLKLTGIEAELNNAVNMALDGFPRTYLRYSQYFLGDYLFASLVALAILAARDADLNFLVPWQKTSAALAGLSFSLYLTHYPLLHAFNHLFPGATITIGLLTLAAAVAFALVFERNKNLARRLIAALLAPLGFVPARRPTSLPS